MSEPKPRKMVRRSVAVALGIICIVLIVALVGAVAYYTMNTTSNTAYNDYVSTHSHTNADYDAMSAPELTLIDLTTINNSIVYSSDIAFWSSWLNVTGYLVNIHKNWAYNCTLHVVAYRLSDNATVLDSYINLGTISGESWAKVGPNLYNVFGEISNYTITPQWTASP